MAARVFDGKYRLVLFISQAAFAARGKIALHRRIGNYGIAYGVLVLAFGLILSLWAPAMHVTAGEWSMDRAASFLTIPLGDMVLFGGFFGAAIAYRKEPEIHKRLMVLATVAVMFAGVFRILDGTMSVFLVLWFLPVLAGMGYDLHKMRRVHPVYWIGVLAMAVALVRIPFGESEAWRGIGRAMLAPLI